MKKIRALDWAKPNKEWVAIAVAVMGVIVAVLIYYAQRIPTWYEDHDQDGFGNPLVSSKSIWQPEGFVQDSSDCYDSNSEARPNAEGYFAVDRGDGSFDYNCSGESSYEQDGRGSCSNGNANQGWEGRVPGCGETGLWLYDCDYKPFRGGEIREASPRTQKCR